MSLVLGLGNPGDRYARTRHNVGWRTIELLVARWSARPDEETSRYRTWRAEWRGHEVVLMVPLTFMNLSGEALELWRESRPLDPWKLLVVSDDVYLPPGFLRIRARGSSGEHNGLTSVEHALGTREYPRLRIGVGEPPPGELREHVLAQPEAAIEQMLDRGIELAAEAVECWIGEGILAAMNQFNRKVPKEVSES